MAQPVYSQPVLPRGTGTILKGYPPSQFIVSPFLLDTVLAACLQKKWGGDDIGYWVSLEDA